MGTSKFRRSVLEHGRLATTAGVATPPFTRSKLDIDILTARGITVYFSIGCSCNPPQIVTDPRQVDEEVGAAIRDSGVPRSELFITSKFWPHFGAPENVEKCLDLCLQNMGIEYLDLFLAHWPVVLQATSDISTAKAFPAATNAEKAIATTADGKAIVDWKHTCRSIAAANDQRGSFVPTWQAMQRLVATGKVRAVGVSNFNISQLQEILSAGGTVPVSCNQVEAHPWFPNTPLLEFMDGAEIMKAVYCPFAGQKKNGPGLIKDPVVLHLAQKNQMGVGQLLQSWAVQRGTVPLGKSQTPGQS